MLPNLRKTLIEVQRFHLICLKIGVKVKRSTPWREINLAFEQTKNPFFFYEIDQKITKM